ncbi:MAG: hypothetical protein H0W40_08665, partial [Methylibium sp.]|nr:hypothetical protein [Methylibium sp.]
MSRLRRRLLLAPALAAAMRQSHAQPAQAQTAAAPVVRPGVPIRLPRDFGSHP